MLKVFQRHKKYLIVFVLVIFLSFALRFTRVLFEKQPIFGDEAIYIRWSQVMRVEPSLRFVPQSDGKQPLFMWATIPFLKIFDDPLFAARLLSVYTGVVATAGVMILTLLLIKSKKVSLMSGLIYAISPFVVFFDSMALADSMLSMFGIWSLIFAVITVKKIRLDTAMLSGFCLGGALLTKSPASFFALLLPLTLIIHKWPKKKKNKLLRLSVFVFLFTFTFVIAYGMYNILRLGPNFHMIAIRNKDYIYPVSHLFSSFLDPSLPFLDRILEYFWIMGPGTLMALFVLGAWAGFTKYKKETLLLLIWGMIPIFAVAEFSKVMTVRYIYFALPYVFIVASLFVRLTIKNLLKKGYIYNKLVIKKLILLLITAFIAHSIFIDYLLIAKPQSAKLPRSERSGYFEEWTSGYGIKEASKLLQNEYETNPDEKIIVGTEGYFGTLPDGLQVYLNDIPEITVIGVGQPLRGIPEPLLESKAFGNKTYLLINNTRILFSYEESEMAVVNEYPKAIRPDGTQEKLQLFRL